MTTSHIENDSRRHFLRGALQGAAGLTLAIYLPGAAAATTAPASPAGFEPNAFVRIGTDNVVTVISKHVEMGQGAYTGLATLVAEELDAAWSQVRVEGAPADATRYNNLAFGPVQGTGGSTSIANSWEQMRKAGASARAMLVSAAAAQWQVPASEIRVSDGVLTHGSHRATFGELATAAAQLPVPADVKLKSPQDYKLIGKQAPRKDSSDKVNGRAVFTQDLHLPGMLTAVVAHPPRLGAKVKSFDASKAKAVKGVVSVVQIPTGVAVLAKDTWSAKKGRDALKIVWDESQAYKLGSEEIFTQFRQLAQKPGLVARNEGDAEAVFASAGAGKVLRASYDFPYLAHAAMEPLNCVVRIGDNECELWYGAQFQSIDQPSVAKLLGLAPEKVKINMLYAGGSFGRRASKDADFVLEAAQIAKASKLHVPIKMVWLREDDMKGGYYRPAFHHTLEASLGADGRPSGWRHRLVGQSIMAGTAFAGMIKDGVDAVSVEGAANLPYGIPALRVELHTPTDVPVAVHWWRSVGSTHTAYSTETFIDELAGVAGQDPVAYRLALLDKHPRHAGALKLAADKAGWGQPLAAGKDGARRGRGVAVHEAFGSYVAEVAEVTVNADGSFSVDRVVCAVDCGIVVNPDVVRAQVEGGVGFALSAALHGAITLKNGAIEQSNFHDYAPIRITEMPKVEVHIVPSAEKPTGIGEPGVPPLAPALANALAAATGKRVRSLPINTEQLKA